MADYVAQDQTQWTTSQDQVTAKTLTATHPMYDQFIGSWIQYLDLYESENLARYIHRHSRESMDSHAARVQRVALRNYCAPVVDLYLHYIFSKPIIRQFADKTPAQFGLSGRRSNALESQWLEWHENVDRRGTKLDRFMVECGRYSQVFGHTFILCDYPRLTHELRTEEERQRQHVYPYVVQYYPTEATNWALDDDGKLLWIRFREPLPDTGKPWMERSLKEKKGIQTVADPIQAAGVLRQRQTRQAQARFRTWTRDEWRIHDVEGNQVTFVDSGKNPLGEVPVVVVYNRPSSRYGFLGQSLLYDIARLNIAILNLDSLIDESVYQSVLNILVIGRQPDEREELVTGPNNVLEYAGDRPPYFLSPSTAPIAFMEDRIQRFREEIYRLAKLGGGLGLEPRSAPSGVALAFEFNETNAVLAERADELENAEQGVHRLWYKWLDADFRGLIDYPDDFAVQSFQEELQLVTAGKQAIRSPLFRKELEKRAARRLLRNAAPDLIDEIGREVDFIPEAVESFTGPVFYDPLAQAIKQPTDPNPIGQLGQLLEQMRGIQPGSTPPNPEAEAEQPTEPPS